MDATTVAGMVNMVKVNGENGENGDIEVTEAMREFRGGPGKQEPRGLQEPRGRQADLPDQPELLV
jgi:hypothetical protein